MFSARTSIPVFVGLCLLAAGCGSKQKPAATQASTASPAATATNKQQAVGLSGVHQDGREVSFQPVFFEYDSDVIRPEYRDRLVDIAAFLQKNPKATLTVEGHTDDRGTTEYNLALGDRRANAIRDYLAQLGIERGRVDTISYGKERPVASGEGESAWSRNRRGELKPQTR